VKAMVQLDIELVFSQYLKKMPGWTASPVGFSVTGRDTIVRIYSSMSLIFSKYFPCMFHKYNILKSNEPNIFKWIPQNSLI
jgi:hypothetical protein